MSFKTRHFNQMLRLLYFCRSVCVYLMFSMFYFVVCNYCFTKLMHYKDSLFTVDISIKLTFKCRGKYFIQLFFEIPFVCVITKT